MMKMGKTLLYSIVCLCILTAAPGCLVATDKWTIQAQQHADCAFCQIIGQRSPATVIYETPDIIVIEKRRQVRGVDCLIIPKKHIENLKSLDMHDPDNAALLNKIVEVANTLSTMITGSGDYSLIVNNGADANQTVFHMHWHFRAPLSQWKSSVAMKQWPAK